MAARDFLDVPQDPETSTLDMGLLERTYRRHWAELLRYVRRTFGSGPPDPEDVVQAAFTRFAALAKPDDVRNPRAFLHRTARNLAIDARRSDARFTLVAKDVETIGAGNRDFSAEDVIGSREEVARVDAALAALPDKQRIALLLHRLDGLSFAEIGRQMGVSPSGARQLVCKGMDACMAILEAE